MSYTPGPWKLDERVGCAAVYPENETHNCLADGADYIHLVYGFRVPDDHTGIWDIDPEKLANAALIAAAPELLEALKRTTAMLVALQNAGHSGDAEKVTEVLRENRHLLINVTKAT